MTEYQFNYDDHTIIVANVDLVYREALWPSRPRKPHLEVSDLSIIVYIGGTDYDVTSGFKPQYLDYFREWFKEQVREKHWDDLVSDFQEVGA